MFQLAPKGQQRISQHDVIRQAVPELGSGDREGSTADCRQFGWWHNKTVEASRTQHSLTREISDVNEWTKVRWRASMYDLVCQNSQLVLYALLDQQSMKADEYISDMVMGRQTVDKTSCCIEYRLELADQVS